MIDDGVDFFGRNRQRDVVERANVDHPLKQAAVDKDVPPVEGQQMFAAGNGSGGADKREFGYGEFVSHESPALRRGGEFGIRRDG